MRGELSFDDGVDAHGFAAARLARDEQVRHLGQVADHGAACDVAAQDVYKRQVNRRFTMKKIVALVLALMLALSMLTVATAETANPVAGKKVAYICLLYTSGPGGSGWRRAHSG